MNVRFFAGTKADYLNLPSPKNPLGLYFCADTQELFWADRLLTDGVRVVPTQQDLPELQKAADGIVYYVTETRNGYVLAPDRSKWLQTIYAPATDTSKVPEDEIYNTVTTVGAVRDIENKIYSTVNSLDERVADIELNISEAGIKAISFAGYTLVETDSGVFTIDRASARQALGFIVPEGQELDEVEFATKAFVENRLESLQSINPDEYAKLADLEGLVTKSEIDTLIVNKADKEHTHTEYLTAIPEEYITESELLNKGYLTSIPAEYITEAELDSKGYLTQHQSLDGFATETWVESKNYLTAEQSLSTYATKEELANAIDSIEHPTVDLTGYVTKTELDGFIKEIPAEYVTESELAAKGYLTEHQDLSEYAKKTDLPTVPTKVSELENDTKFITEVNLVDYAKKSDIPVDYITSAELQEELNKIEHPSTDLTNYVTKDEIDGFISEIPEEYVTETELTTKGYLTEQNLSGYATESFVTEAIANIDVPKVNTKDFVTLETFAQTLGSKANEVPFNTDKFVTNPIGNFVTGETLKGLSIAEIFAKILGLTDVAPLPPDIEVSIKDKILNNELSLYVLNESGELVEEPYKFNTFEGVTANSTPTETCFYVIKNSAGEPEYGYQHITETKEMYYIVALPTDFILGETTKLMTWDAASGTWIDVDASTLTNNYEAISNALAEVDLVLPTLEGYTFWADLNQVDPGVQYRFVITEEV